MRTRILAALALIGALAAPAWATVPSPFVATVVEGTTNTTSTFGFLASYVQVHNDGAQTIYCLFDAVPTSSTGIPIPAGRARTFDFRASPPNQAPLVIGCLTASSTSSTRIEAYGFFGGAVSDFEVANSSATAGNVPLLGFSVTPPASATPPATAAFGVPSVGTNLAGGPFTVGPGAGTGNVVAGAQYNIQRDLIGASGAAAQSQAPAVVVCGSKTMSNTSATPVTMAQIVTPSNSGGSLSIFYGTTATDGTNFDSDSASMNVAWVNKAGTLTQAVGTLSSIAQQGNSGTVASTASAVVSGVNLNLTLSPTYATIVPTSVTSFMTIINHGPAVAIACQ